MADPRAPQLALLIVAAFSRHEAALTWARAQIELAFGPIELASPSYAFNQTRYYEPTMGSDLRKQFFAVRDLIDPQELASIKLRTNELEREMLATGRFPEPRPLNLDPGLLTLGKFILATTKDQQHRIYLRDGIHAEVTLRFRAGAWEPWEWTYADYREQSVREFLVCAREYYRECLSAKSGVAG